MLATSLGFKLCDACRRILLYTKPDHAHKGFYSFCRGWFPIQELCGTMTAIGLAKRDLLGIRMPIWKLLGPAIVIHAMANFRGMKVSTIVCKTECFEVFNVAVFIILHYVLLFPF